jgi:hypothetical protein
MGKVFGNSGNLDYQQTIAEAPCIFLFWLPLAGL